jgi:oxygen-independent coproporphyrinogen-3 oxidase
MSKVNHTTTIPVELLKKYDRPGPRYTSYPTAPVWNGEVGNTTYTACLKAAAEYTETPLALYCHIPFCQKRCFYCGCTTYVSKGKAGSDEYLDYLIKEIRTVAEGLGRRRKVNQLHFGGGTPSFIGVDGFERLLAALDAEFEFIDGCEKSIELDPRVATIELLDFLAGKGFNRASIGVQDFNSDVQEAIGRIQSEKQVRAMLDRCRALGFKGINFDLIYGLPLQTETGFSETLDRVIALRPDRLAVYSFAYLPKLKANQQKILPTDLPSADLKYRLFSKAIEKFTAAGYRQIGMDHFALPNDELSIAQAEGRLYRNFMGYSIQTAPDMIGLGMSAIGYIDDTFVQNDPKLKAYKEAVETAGTAVYRGKRLSRDDLIRQYAITSMMCNFGLNFSRMNEKFGIDGRDYFADETTKLDGFVADGLLKVSEGGLEITETGRTFVRNIAMTFDAYLGKPTGGTRPTFSKTI